MHNTERTLIYGAIAGLAVLALCQFPAHTAAPAPQDLGPADSVILTGKDGNMSVKNGAGRLQWGDQATAKAWSVAAVHSDKIMKALLDSNRFKDEAKALDDDYKSKDEEFRKRYKDFSEKYKDVQPGSPEFDDANKEYQQFMKSVSEWRSSYMTKRSKLQADQIEKAYRELTAAVDVVAERQKIDLVFRFVPTAAKFTGREEHAKSPDADEDEMPQPMLVDTMDQVRARTFLHYPEAIDITTEVLKELNIKEE